MSDSQNHYKSTLNLPQTSFPMRAGLQNLEPKILELWQGLYPKIRKASQGKEKFILHDGPPYANGEIHLGHALNKILKDMIIKSKTLQGYDSPYVPGWDCHGLPIEAKVEKEMGKSGVHVDPKMFRKACREYAKSQIKAQKEEFIRLGVIGDWDNHYETQEFKIEAEIMRYIAKLVKNGNVIKDEKALHWCISCQCALAEAEVEHDSEYQSDAIDVAFLAKDVKRLSKCFKAEITPNAKVAMVIWTTTPWTIPANQAIALNSNFQYLLVKVNDSVRERVDFDYFIVAKTLAEDCHQRFFGEKMSENQIKAEVDGKVLEYQEFQHPFYDRVSPVWLGGYVKLETGTGAVHTAPSHGADDFYLGADYQAKLLKCVNTDGTFNANAPGFEGVNVFKANSIVIEKLHQKKRLVHSEKYIHSYPLCWRHKTPLIFLTTPQWFISMSNNNLRAHSLDAIEQVEWIPAWGRERIKGMVANRHDWCISRQRSWGSPLGLVIHKKTKAIHPKMPEIFEKVSLEVEKKGIDAWFDIELSSLIDDYQDYTKSSDVLDVWLDSGTTHETVLKKWPDLRFPADLYLEGSDQHRGWFHSSLLTSVALNKSAPYRAVLTHGFVVDEQGKKFSKSIGNMIQPQEIIKQWGADILRLWVAQSDYTADLSVSNSIIKSNADIYRRIRNTLRFLLSNLSDFDVNQDMIEFNDLLLLDRFALFKTAKLQKEILNEKNGHYSKYQFHTALRKINLFCTGDMGGFYLDVIKDRLYTCQKNSQARRSAQSAMYHILRELTLLLAPIISFTAEEVWQTIKAMNPKEKENSSIFIETAKEIDAPLNQSESEQLEIVQKIKLLLAKQIEQMRNNHQIGAALEAEVVIYLDNAMLKIIEPIASELHFLFITSSVSLLPLENAPKEALEDEHDKDIKFLIAKSREKKCTRCWHHHPSVGKSDTHPEICERCEENIDKKGEIRQFA